MPSRRHLAHARAAICRFSPATGLARRHRARHPRSSEQRSPDHAGCQRHRKAGRGRLRGVDPRSFCRRRWGRRPRPERGSSTVESERHQGGVIGIAGDQAGDLMAGGGRETETEHVVTRGHEHALRPPRRPMYGSPSGVIGRDPAHCSVMFDQSMPSRNGAAASTMRSIRPAVDPSDVAPSSIVPAMRRRTSSNGVAPTCASPSSTV